MFADRALALLKVRPDEVRMVALVALFFGLVDLGREIGESAVSALFFHRYGVEYLPYLYIALGVTTFAASLGYAVFLAHLDKRRFFVLLLAFMALLLLGERAAILLDLQVLYPLLWLSVHIIGSLLYMVTWTAAGDICDTRQAKRLFPIFVSASILGALLGSLIIGPAARLFGTENLIVAFVVVLVAAMFLLRNIARRYFQEVERAREPSTFLSDIRVGFDYVGRSPLLQKVAIYSLLISVLYFAVSFPFGLAVAESFPDEAELAGFIGLFDGIATALMFVVALLIANRLYARIGIVNALLIQPIIYLLGFVLFAANFSLGSAVAVCLTQLVVSTAISDGAYSTFFNVVPSERRAEVRAFDAGVPAQIGTVLSGVMLILVEQWLTQTSIFVMGMIVAVICAYVVWRMRASYTDSLVAALQAGRVEVFTASDRIFSGLRGDADAIRIVTAALNEPTPVAQQLAAEMLANMGAVSAIPALIGRLGSVNAGVRTTIARVLGQLGARQAARPVMQLLRDPEPVVRSAALTALPSLCDSDDPELPGAITLSLLDPDCAVRVQAAISLARCDMQHALVTLTSFLHDATCEVDLLCVLQAFEAILKMGASCSDQTVCAAIDAVVGSLQEESPAVRSAACRVLPWAPNPTVLAALSDRLSDSAPVVRAAAAKSLRQVGPAVIPVVLPQLLTTSDPATVLDALPPGDPSTYEPLRSYAEVEAGRLQMWREVSRAIPDAGPVTRFLSFTLRANAAQSEQNLIKTIGLIGHQAVIQQVAKSMQTADSQVRSTAVEALDVLGDKQLVKEIVPLLEEREPQEAAESNRAGQAEQAVRSLAADQDEWLRVVANQAASELGLSHDLGGSVDISPALLLLQRTLLLKEVALFSDLTPSDLVQIAQVAQERWFPDGAILCREGEVGDDLFLIAEGQVRVTKQIDGEELFLVMQQKGEIIGEMAIIESKPRSATVRAVGDTRTLVINSVNFWAILRERPEVSRAVMRVLSRRLRERIETLVPIHPHPSS